MTELRVAGRLQEAARMAAEAAGARWAAIITGGHDGAPTRVICASTDPDVVADTYEALRSHRHLDSSPLSGRAPVGTLRASDLSRSGTVQTHLGTRSIALPIETEDGAYGTLVVMGPTRGDFTAEHRALVASVAESVAGGLERATAVEEMQRHVDWLDASARVSRQLLRSSSSVMVTVQEIGAHVLRLSDARSLTIAVISPDDPAMLEVRVAAGAGISAGRTYPRTGSLAGAVMDRGRGELNPANELYSHDVPTGPDRRTVPVVAVPIHGVDAGPRGAMVVHRRAEQPPFDRTDLNMAEDFARQTSLALELAEKRLTHEKSERRKKYERSIQARNDELLQDLFSIGMTIQQAQVGLRTGDPTTAASRADPHLDRAVDDLNEIIRQLRTALEA